MMLFLSSTRTRTHAVLQVYYRSTHGFNHVKPISMLSLTDYEAHAKNVLDKNAWDYYSSGANQEQSLLDNVEAFKRY